MALTFLSSKRSVNTSGNQQPNPPFLSPASEGSPFHLFSYLPTFMPPFPTPVKCLTPNSAVLTFKTLQVAAQSSSVYYRRWSERNVRDHLIQG